jgi:hypothetical protein
MRSNGRYRIVGVQGKPTDAKGRIITVEDREAVRAERKKEQIKELKRSIIVTTVLSLILAAICFGVVIYRTHFEFDEITTKEIATEEIATEVTTETETEIEEEEEVETVTIPDTDDFHYLPIPLGYSEQEALYRAANEFDVPYELAVAVVWKETQFRNVPGDGGEASGYMQVWKRWHGDRMESLGVSDLNDAEGNFRVGCSYLGELLDRYGNTHKALMAYNAGESGAAEMWAKGYTSSDYSRKVIGYMEGII